MLGPKFRVMTLWGFPIYVDLSWFIILVLLTWSLAALVFPHYYEGLSPTAYWSMGLSGALGLFACVVLHELAHSVVARRYGVPIRGITLFIFGGVAEMTKEPPTPKIEFLIAIAGPVASFMIGAACGLLEFIGRGAGSPVAITGVFWYLAWLNTVLAVFNLIPAFPLDGGRVLRSVLWHVKGDVKWATRITSTIGGAFGLALMVLGVLSFVQGQYVGGMWQFLIGMFLRSAAQMSYQQLIVRRALEGETVARLMQPDVKTVPPNITVKQLVEDYIYRHHHKMFPVTDDGRLLGCVTTRSVAKVARDTWNQRTVAEVLEPCTEDNTIKADEDASKALARMSKQQASRLMVIEGKELRGVVALKDLLRFVSLKLELEGDSELQDPRSMP